MRSTNWRFAVVAAISAFSFPSRSPVGLVSLGDAMKEATADGLTSDPTAVSWGSGRIDVFARGPDNALWHKSYSDSWSGWESLGGSLASGPDVASWGSGRLDVFARGTDDALWHLPYQGQWGGWESLGGSLTGDPTAASWGPGRLDVFARGTDGALWHRPYEGQWGTWESLGGSLASSPDVASWGSGRLDVFVRGYNLATPLQHKWYEGGWSGWESLAGPDGMGLNSDPSAVAWASGRLDVFLRGADWAVWHIAYADRWSGWESLGGQLSSGPDAASWGNGRLDLFGRGYTDNTLQHRSYAGQWSGWEGLGAPTIAPPTPTVPTGTGVTPAIAQPGSWVRVTGQTFTKIRDVQFGSTSLKWSKISDTEFDLQLPNPGGYGGVPIPVALLTNDGTASGSINPPPILAYPPIARGFNYYWGECCIQVTVFGNGLLDPAGYKPTIKVNGTAVPTLGGDNKSALFQLPNPAPGFAGGPLTVGVEHSGGGSAAPNPFIMVMGPTVITSISPAEIPVGVTTTVTVTGSNLARARGICLPPHPGSSVPWYAMRTTEPATSNDQFQVVVNSTDPINGPVTALVEQSPSRWSPTSSNPTGWAVYRSPTTCQSNPTPIYIQFNPR